MKKIVIIEPKDTKIPPWVRTLLGMSFEAEEISGGCLSVYKVSTEDVVAALAEKDPPMAKWWEENYLLISENGVLFPKKICQLVS